MPAAWGPRLTDRIETILFSGPAGRLEGLWKDVAPPRRGGAVFAHPHPLFGGTLHNKVVYRVARALVDNGWATLRFNFRGVGLSEGVHDQGVGETLDFGAAADEVERRTGGPLLAGGFSFGSAAALRASGKDARVAAFLGVGLPVATESIRETPRPRVPALFVVGEQDTYGPPELLREFVGDSGEVVVVPGTGHFFEGRLPELEAAVGSFLRRLPISS
ncbi:MAG: alpha/beta hydrolase [Acidobacteria bacterium]|nr:alpha/beta hydrolase [Acidobacteriota bacterium]MCA1609591.1 alpha/beta hydrolase [Acidobacteriota bacterium]